MILFFLIFCAFHVKKPANSQHCLLISFAVWCYALTLIYCYVIPNDIISFFGLRDWIIIEQNVNNRAVSFFCGWMTSKRSNILTVPGSILDFLIARL